MDIESGRSKEGAAGKHEVGGNSPDLRDHDLPKPPAGEFVQPWLERPSFDTSKDRPEIAEMRQRAALGDPEAMYDMAALYAGGRGGAESTLEAARWMQMGMERGHEGCALDLGHLLTSCALGNVPLSEGIACYEVAASLGNTQAMYNLGVIYMAENDEQNPERGVALMRQAAEGGNPKAQGAMSLFYLSGTGVPQDARQAALWASEGAQNGDPNSLGIMGQLLMQGIDGRLPDVFFGLEATIRSAEAGNPGAIRKLSEFYTTGALFPEDTEQAKMLEGLADLINMERPALVRSLGLFGLDPKSMMERVRSDVHDLHESVVTRAAQGDVAMQLLLAGHLSGMTASAAQKAEGLMMLQRLAAQGNEGAIRHLEVITGQDA